MDAERYEGGTGLPGRSRTRYQPAHRRDRNTVSTSRAPHGSSFELEFAVDGSRSLSSDLGPPAASGQVGIAIDTDGSPVTTVEFRDFRIFVPMEDLIRS
jgi:hypothetical protein